LRRRGAAATSQSPEIAFEEAAMRAEVQTIVDDIKQSIGLLRRHL